MALRSLGLWLASLVVLGGCAHSTEGSTTPDEESPPTTAASLEDGGAIRLSEGAQAFVRVEPAAMGADVNVLRAPAQVAYRDGSVAEVGAPAAGRITEVRVRSGEHVEAGAPLFVLRSPDAAAMRAELAGARTELETALAEARRSEEMLAHGVGTERERREADLRVAELEIQLARVRTQVSIVGGGSGGQVTVTAPIAGTVLSRRAAVGMSVVPNDEQALIEIGDPSALGVTADVFDRDAGSVHEGAHVEVTFPSLPAPVSGRVAYVGPAVSTGVRTVPVRIELDALPPDARPGLFGRAAITLDDEGIVLPASAVLVRDGDRTVVYVEAEPGLYMARDVDVRATGDGRVRVASGVGAGDRVVVEGGLLIDGAADLLL